MAVQQNKKSPSKRGMHRAHDFLTSPQAASRSSRRRAKCICVTTSARAVLSRQEDRQDQERVKLHPARVTRRSRDRPFH